MGDTMLHGVLNMPPELWDDSEIDKHQRYHRYLEASRKIEDLQRIIQMCFEDSCTASGKIRKKTAPELAEKFGITKSYVYEIKHGRKRTHVKEV